MMVALLPSDNRLLARTVPQISCIVNQCSSGFQNSQRQFLLFKTKIQNGGCPISSIHKSWPLSTRKYEPLRVLLMQIRHRDQDIDSVYLNRILYARSQ